MANPITFYSRSAKEPTVFIPSRLSEAERVEAVLAGRFHIFWAGGVDDEFLEYGNSLGFKNRRYDGGDPSLLIQSQLVVYYNMDSYFPKMLESINLCTAYAVPLVWVHNRHAPDKWIWSFSTCLVQQGLTPVDIWRAICQILT